MRRISRYIFYASIFTIFLFGGIFFAKKIITVVNSQNNPSDSEILQATNQAQLGVFIVDEVDSTNPNLKMIWSVNIFKQSPKQITFFELINSESGDFEKLIKVFQLDDQNYPTPKSLKAIEQHFSIKWDGIIIVDNNALNKLSQWVSKAYPENFSGNNISDNYSDLWGFCNYINDYDSAIIPQFDLNILSNSDFHTTFSFEEIIDIISLLTENENPKCKIILTN